jgi:hypothetical protein
VSKKVIVAAFCCRDSVLMAKTIAQATIAAFDRQE